MSTALYLAIVAIGPIALLVGLAVVLLWRPRADRSVESTIEAQAHVEPPEQMRRRELAIQLAVGFAWVLIGSLAGWAYLATAIHG